MPRLPDALQYRQANHPIESIFLRRWSPRAMTGETISPEELLTLFEAARWAPSTYNEQEWRFLYAFRDTPHWQTFFDLLMPANQVWCAQAAVLIVLASHKVFERNGKPNPVHTLDTGAAMENLLLQAAVMNVVAHGMAGFDRDRAREALSIPDDYDVEAMLAIGRPGDPEKLPEELRSREVPSGRRPLQEVICEGPFAFAK
jgi:nitroreductase